MTGLKSVVRGQCNGPVEARSSTRTIVVRVWWRPADFFFVDSGVIQLVEREKEENPEVISPFGNPALLPFFPMAKSRVSFCTLGIKPQLELLQANHIQCFNNDHLRRDYCVIENLSFFSSVWTLRSPS